MSCGALAITVQPEIVLTPFSLPLALFRFFPCKRLVTHTENMSPWPIRSAKCSVTEPV